MSGATSLLTPPDFMACTGITLPLCVKHNIMEEIK